MKQVSAFYLMYITILLLVTAGLPFVLWLITNVETLLFVFTRNPNR